MAVEQQQQAIPGAEQSGSCHRDAAQGGAKQLRVVVVSRQQGDRKAQGFEQPSELHVARQALVLAEVAAEQQQIRRPVKGGEGLLQPVGEPATRPSASVAALHLRQEVGITELQDPHPPSRLLRLSCLGNLKRAMAAIPPGTRQRCSLCQVELQGMPGGADLVHFSQGAPGTRAKLWARVCQYLRSDDQKRQCLNQDASLRGELQRSDYYAEAPVIDLSTFGAPGGGGSDPVG